MFTGLYVKHSEENALSDKQPKAPAPQAKRNGPDLEDGALHQMVLTSLDDDLAQDIVTINLEGKSALADHMVIASGTSSRHVKSLADHVVQAMKKKYGVVALGSEGTDVAEWVLVDFDSVVLHVMQPPIREFYDLERLWERRIRGLEDSGEA